MVNNTITCERDTGSPTSNNAASNTVTNELINCVQLYSPLNTFLSYAYASDYMPFEDNNEVITGFFETNETPHRHTATDLLVNMDPVYVYNIAKAAAGAMLHFAVAATTFSIVTVFFPIGFMEGIIGRFFKQFGLTVAFVVLLSMLVSFTAPFGMLCAVIEPEYKVRYRDWETYSER